MFSTFFYRDGLCILKAELIWSLPTPSKTFDLSTNTLHLCFIGLNGAINVLCWMFCGVAHITRQADGWELHCSSFSGRKPILKLAGRSLHPIHHLLILWNGRKSRSLISILPVKVDKAPEASVDTSSTDLIICPQSIYLILVWIFVFLFILAFLRISDQTVNQQQIGFIYYISFLYFAFMSCDSDLFSCSKWVSLHSLLSENMVYVIIKFWKPVEKKQSLN